MVISDKANFVISRYAIHHKTLMQGYTMLKKDSNTCKIKSKVDFKEPPQVAIPWKQMQVAKLVIIISAVG